MNFFRNFACFFYLKIPNPADDRKENQTPDIFTSNFKKVIPLLIQTSLDFMFLNLYFILILV